MSGLFGTRASTTADFTLLLQIIIFIIMLVAIKFAKEKTPDSLKKHERIMTVVVVLNAFSILFSMTPSLISNAGAALDEAAVIGFPLTLVHHTFGLVAEILGAVWVFKKLGNIKQWMLITFSLWIITLTLGIVFYVNYYVL